MKEFVQLKMKCLTEKIELIKEIILCNVRERHEQRESL